MKTLMLILFPVLVFAGTESYQDTIYTNSESKHACRILDVDENSVEIIFGKNQKSSPRFSNLSKVILDGLGVIFTSDEGLKHDLVTIQNYINQRNSIVHNKEVIIETVKRSEENKYSFGIMMMSEQFQSTINVPTEYVNSTYFLNSLMKVLPTYEGQFTFNVERRWFLTLNIGYNYLNSTISSGDTESSTLIRVLLINIGPRIYLQDVLGKKVRPFISASIGRRFAFVNMERSPSNGADYSDRENTLEDFLSNWLFGLGFGAEYYFNQSISLTTNMKFYYTSQSAEYEEYNYPNTYTIKQDYS